MTFKSRAFVESLAHQKAPGPSTTFCVFHIFNALELMSEKPIGRNKLAEKMGVGEGAIRTIIKRLKDAGLIVASKTGCSLTPKGLSLWKEFEEIFPKRVEIEKNELTSSEYNYAFLIKNSGQKVKSGIEQRDAAIVAGARNVIAIVDKRGNLAIDAVSVNIEKNFPNVTNQIFKKIKPKDNDVIIIAGADSPLKAKHGAFHASWTLLDNDKTASARSELAVP
jgi:predicted transcriptional regulator